MKIPKEAFLLLYAVHRYTLRSFWFVLLPEVTFFQWRDGWHWGAKSPEEKVFIDAETLLLVVSAIALLICLQMIAKVIALEFLDEIAERKKSNSSTPPKGK